MSEPLTHRKASGHFEITGWYGEIEEGQTLSCVHCQHSWIVQKGSGKMRGFCQRCMGYICGAACATCIPAELRWDNEEAGRPALTPAPVRILVPEGIGLLTGYNGLGGTPADLDGVGRPDRVHAVADDQMPPVVRLESDA